jgi:hypothetical protein
MMKRFNVTLVFTSGVYGTFNSRFFAKSKTAAKAQAIEWANQCGFVGSIKKAEIVELDA